MGVFELLLWVVLICIIGSLAIWARRQLAPQFPPLVDTVIGVFCLVVIIWLMLTALGLMPVRDPKVPSLR
jgi:threonine/homoserine/homoserine lactone efflux protein